MPYDKTKPYSCPCCGYWNGDMKYDYYKHKEPLIKDEKIRKAVRAWADACNLRYAVYKQSTNEFYDPNTRGRFAIKFLLKPIEVYLNDGEYYTITELCGEEEE